MKNKPKLPLAQHGAVVTLEYLVIMIMGGISALGVTVLLAGQFPEISMGWFTTLIDTAEGAFEDYNTNWCAQAAIATGTGTPDLLAQLACGTAGGGGLGSGPSWTDIAGTVP